MAMMTYREVSKLLSVPIGTLYAYVSQDKIPYVRLGRRLVRFKEQDVLKWVEQNSVLPARDRSDEPTAL